MSKRIFDDQHVLLYGHLTGGVSRKCNKEGCANKFEI